ncbi:hypothetical protein ACIQZO_05885 [Streptomyces sp. NPDC097617]|uniref:hypothetical protein n=1 Tax=Streptomyces sp. NPDC097617 TaxID=3366091 RepID=UPI003801AC44
MTTEMDTPATALYVEVDDPLKASPHLAPRRPRVGLEPKLSDAEPVILAVMQSLLGFVSEARWLRCATPTLAQQLVDRGDETLRGRGDLERGQRDGPRPGAGSPDRCGRRQLEERPCRCRSTWF